MGRTASDRQALLCAALLVLVGANPAHAQTAQEIASSALRATLLLTMEDTDGQPLRFGSGFLVGDGKVASSYHVVEGAPRGYANFVGQKTKYDLRDVVAVDPERDLVVIEISASGVPVLPLGNSDTVQVGDVVYTVGNPQRWEGTFSQGIVSSIREFQFGTVLQITAPISPGSSGGPVLNSAGEVIGIAVSTVRDGQNLNFAVPANYLAALLERSSSTKPAAISRYDGGALLSLAHKYYHGDGVEPNYEEAARLYRIAAERGNVEAQQALGFMYYVGLGVLQDYAEAARWTSLAAEQGDASAQTLLGILHYFGLGMPQGYAEAAGWFRLASEQGDASAQALLANMYYFGQGVPQDYAEAARWYRFAAEQGDVEAQRLLGIMHYFGQGMQQDYAEAARWYRLAAEQGNADAQTRLGLLYYGGQGVSKDYAEAARWYRLAAGQGDAEAQWLLGGMYYFGVGVLQDYVEAVRWHRLAAEQGNADGQWSFGFMYYLGAGVPKNNAEAARWYRLAAEQGHSSAQWWLGRLYRDGEGVPKNSVAAHAWLNLAAAQGDDDAAADRDELARRMTASQIAGAQALARTLWSRIVEEGQ